MRAILVFFLLLLASVSVHAATETVSWSGDQMIPDGRPEGYNFSLAAPDNNNGLAKVEIQFETTYANDVLVAVYSPSDVALIRDRSGGSGDISASTVFCYSDNATASCDVPAEGSLAALGNQQGVWNVFFSDSAAEDYLRVHSVKLTFNIKRCDSGYFFNTTDSTCTVAPVGYAADGDELTMCYNGKYQPDVGQAVCLEAQAGFFVPNDTQPHTASTPCTSGSYTNVTGCSACITAPAGYAAPSTTDLPVACNDGKYQPSTGHTACLTCPANTGTPDDADGYARCYSAVEDNSVLSEGSPLIVKPWVVGASSAVSASISTADYTVECFVKAIGSNGGDFAVVPVVSSFDEALQLGQNNTVTVNLSNGVSVTAHATALALFGDKTVSVDGLGVSASTDGTVCMTNQTFAGRTVTLTTVTATPNTTTCEYETSVSTSDFANELSPSLTAEYVYSGSELCFELDRAVFASDSNFAVKMYSGDQTSEQTVWTHIEDGKLCFTVPTLASADSLPDYDTHTEQRTFRLYSGGYRLAAKTVFITYSAEEETEPEENDWFGYFIAGALFVAVWGGCCCMPCFVGVCLVCLPLGLIVGCISQRRGKKTKKTRGGTESAAAMYARTRPIMSMPPASYGPSAHEHLPPVQLPQYVSYAPGSLVVPNSH
ncbi:CEGP1 protein [Carpediemonas membranifera]|uniref:CEGP1 protein n=1 Tax=Carpediemonas membranifera TaxID=201153 RepID=A0A8J6E7Y4_9EUKA|nr:CEGP1 protein [Carpediemonas membranifera]|eukprot:KAG9391210.1 CEGP1 protein [Carpediemonas membranifera]